VAMHAVASMLMLGVYQHMFAVLEDCVATPMQDGHQQHDGRPVQQTYFWRVPCRTSYRLRALLAGLMFALHPIHTEVRVQAAPCLDGHALQPPQHLM